MKTFLLIFFLLAGSIYPFGSTQSIAPAQVQASVSVTPSNPTVTVVQGSNAPDLVFTISGGAWTSFDTCQGFDVYRTSSTTATAKFHVQNFAVGNYPCSIKFTIAGKVKLTTVTVKVKPKPTPTPTPRPTSTPRPTPTPIPTVTPIQRRSVNIQWEYRGVHAVSFKIYYGKAGGTELGPISVPAVAGQTIYSNTIFNLDISSRYYFILDAILDDQEERYSSTYNCLVTSTGCQP